MQSLTEHLTFTVPARMGFVNITPQVAALVARSGVKEGLCLVTAMHITASAAFSIADRESRLSTANSTAAAQTGCS